MWEKNSFDIVFNFFLLLCEAVTRRYVSCGNCWRLIRLSVPSGLRLYRTATVFYFPFFILINQRWPRFFAVVVKKENTQTQKTALLFLCVFLITYNQIWMIAITFYLVFSLMIATITCCLLYRYLFILITKHKGWSTDIWKAISADQRNSGHKNLDGLLR